jgi:hypothetical protein
MNDRRFQATIVIWLALVAIVGILAGVVIASGFSVDLWAGVMLFVLMLSTIIGVTVSTEAIWGVEKRETGDRAFGHRDHFGQREQVGKMKRDPYRIDRLMDDLSEDEIYELESRLLAREDRKR